MIFVELVCPSSVIRFLVGKIGFSMKYMHPTYPKSAPTAENHPSMEIRDPTQNILPPFNPNSDRNHETLLPPRETQLLENKLIFYEDQ
jgi:hypothetical protein